MPKNPKMIKMMTQEPELLQKLNLLLDMSHCRRMGIYQRNGMDEKISWYPAELCS